MTDEEGKKIDELERIDKTNVAEGALVGGSMCLIAGLICRWISWGWGLGFAFYGPLFFGALVLSIIAMVQGRAGGVLLFLATIVLPLAIIFIKNA